MGTSFGASRAVIGAAAVFGVVGAVAVHRARAPSTASVAVAEVPDAGLATPFGDAGADTIRRVIANDFVRTYRVRSRSTTVLGPGQSFVFQVGGALTVVFAESTPHGARFQVSISDVALGSGTEGQNPAAAKALAAELTLPFFVTIDAAGHVVELSVPVRASTVVAGLRKHLATLLQYEVRAEPRWETSEKDSTGTYHARYKRSGSRLAREKEFYSKLLTPRGVVEMNPDVRRRVSGLAELELGTDHWPETLKSRERAVASAGAGLRDLVSERVDELIRVASDEGLPHAVASRLEGYETVALDSLELYVAEQATADEGVVKGRSASVLLSAMDATDEASANEAMSAFAAYLRLHPDQAERASSRLVRYDAGAKRVFGALSAAGTSEAQSVLADLVRNEAAPPAAREDGAIALSMSENPTRETLDALRSRMNDANPDVASAATLAAANVARKVADMEPDASADLIADLLKRLDAATDPDVQILLLRALGNAGDARVVPVAARLLASADNGVRAAACEALTFVRVDTADVLLAQTMVRDPTAYVRTSSIRVSMLRPVEHYFDALAEVLRVDAVEDVRLVAVQRLGVTLVLPRARQLVQHAARTDPSANVRAAAAAIVAPPPKR